MKEKRKKPSNPAPVIARFLDIWLGRKWEQLPDVLQITYAKTTSDSLPNTERQLAGMPLAYVKVLRAIKVSPVIIDYHVECDYADGRDSDVRVIRMVCESGVYDPDPCGNWGVNPISIYRVWEGEGA
ncbi:MAG: hypothetical protein M5R41_10335 [Bacteroidia bacterium]|nr:hypothetical protein [Bacteroidia bacterium]